MTGLSICQTHVKYPLERRPPLSAFGGCPLGLAVPRRGSSWRSNAFPASVLCRDEFLLARSYSRTQSTNKKVCSTQTSTVIEYFLFSLRFSLVALKNRPPGTFHNFSLRDPRQLLTFYRLLKYSFVLFLLQIIVMARTKLVISLRVREGFHLL